ncbi:MAG TPA: hypothetical protein VGC50_05625 [Gammaproteobacteria bacterium]|jgi:hypothetical protein
MLTNLSPEYKKAEQAFRTAREPRERLDCLKETLRTVPKLMRRFPFWSSGQVCCGAWKQQTCAVIQPSLSRDGQSGKIRRCSAAVDGSLIK